MDLSSHPGASAWLLGLTVREYRALEAGDAAITSDLWNRMVEVFQWPLAFGGSTSNLLPTPGAGPRGDL
jgi:hypothetical protein